MRAVIQRVSRAAVEIDGEVAGQIDRGGMILLGIEKADTTKDAVWLADKLARLRIFPDEAGNMNRSLLDIGGAALVVSQFTLHARTRKGTRPSFNDAALPEQAIPLYEQFVAELQKLLGKAKVATGRFGAAMQVSLVNDGPVTIIVDSPQTKEA
jgi:D-tyrosyl-tRNA(Tyr) deacylase